MRVLTTRGGELVSIVGPTCTHDDCTDCARLRRAGTGFHALRHYYASLLIRHGESVKTVQARLGHASAVETLDTYSHLWPDSDDRTRDAIDSVLGSTAYQLRTGEPAAN